MNVIVIQSEGAVKLYPSPKGSSSRQEIINLLLMAARTLAPSLLAWNVMEQLVFLHVFVVPFGHVREKGADVTDYTTIGIVMRHLLNCSILINYHAIISHVVLDIVIPAIDCAIGILQLR
jgi:hypothetical protein